MTILNPHHIKIDGHVLATYANALETVDGVDGIPGRRIRTQDAAYQDGGYPALSLPTFLEPRRQRLRIWVAPFDVDGAVTFTGGPEAHLRANLEALYLLLGGKAISNHTVQMLVPTSAGTPKTLENYARISGPVNARNSSRLVRRLDIDLEYPYPGWRDVTTGLVTLGPYTGSQSFTPGGTHPLSDATLICTAAGRVTHTQSGDFAEVTNLDGATSITITQRPPRTVLKNSGADARGFYNANRPWGLRFPAATLADLTITGTWSITYYNLEH